MGHLFSGFCTKPVIARADLAKVMSQELQPHPPCGQQGSKGLSPYPGNWIELQSSQDSDLLP